MTDGGDPRRALQRDALAALAADDAVRAVTEAGSAAFGRDDELSDVDLLAWLAPGSGQAACEGALGRLESRLARLDADAGTMRVPPPPGCTWAQAFIRSTRRPLLDIVVLDPDPAATDLQRWVSVPRHGEPRVLLDRDDTLAAGLPHTDEAALAERRQADLGRELRRIATFRGVVDKELARGRIVDAHHFHRAILIGSLVLLLGMVHRPLRYDFGLRYLHDELPPEVLERLLRIVEPAGPEELRRASREALAWIEQLAADLEAGG